MHTLWLVVQREFVSNVLTSRFMIGFIVCLLSTAVAVFVQVGDYEKRLVGYPVFEEQISYRSVLSQVGLLVLFNLLSFISAQVSFMKSDLK